MELNPGMIVIVIDDYDPVSSLCPAPPKIFSLDQYILPIN